MFKGNYNSNLTQFSKDSLNWSKITKDSLRKVSEPWESLDKTAQQSKSLKKSVLNGKSIELIKPDTCDVFGPQNSQRVIRRKLISKDVENIDPSNSISTKKHKSYKKSEDYKQSLEILNYVAYETIPADRSYQTLIFDSEASKNKNINLKSELDMPSKYLEAANMFGAYAFQRLITFRNNQNYLLKDQRINAFSLENQLGLKFTKFVFSYYFIHYKQNFGFTTNNTFALFAFTFLTLVCNYISLTYSNKSEVSHSNKEILRVINASSLSFLIKKYILGQSIFSNLTTLFYFSKAVLTNFGFLASPNRSFVHVTFLALIFVNIIASLDELLFDLIPTFVTISNTETTEPEYEGNSLDESIFKAESSFNKETASIESELI